MKVLELKGYKSLRALNAFNTLMLGLKMLPSYEEISYESFFENMQNLSVVDQEKLIREAVLFVELQREELEAMLCFCCDKNGIPYSAENLKNLGPKDLIEIVVAVSKEIAKIKIDFVTENEKKN